MNCGGKLLDLTKPALMAIVNVTPDSFYDGHTSKDEKTVLTLCEQHLKHGASILDIGGQSTKPGAEQIGSENEMKRVIPAIKYLSKAFPNAIISVDTYHAKVAQEAANNGATIINDVSGGSLDNKMLGLVSQLNIPFIASHIQGNPMDMQKKPTYHNVTTQVYKRFSTIKSTLLKRGFNDLIFDPGFGFGKTTDQNFELLHNLNHFKSLSTPILVGLSRKSMIWKTLRSSPQEALNGTTSLHTIALLKGANILRVHDVKEAAEVVALVDQLA